MANLNVKSAFFTTCVIMWSITSRAQFELYKFEEIENGGKLLAKYHDSLTYTTQQFINSVYYIDFNLNKECKKSYRILTCTFYSDLLSKRYNYYFSIYNRYFIFYSDAKINNHRIEQVNEAFREKLKHLVFDDSTFGCGDPGMGCEFNDCAKNKLYLAYPPGSRYINRKTREE
jgi:hypothetical protein